MKLLYGTLLMLSAIAACNADVYLHNPRGSNNRNCEKNDNRQNGQRLFDSQNNDAGGYACPRAEPFACYRLDGDDKNACNAQNKGNENENLVSSTAPNNLVGNYDEYTAMDRMYYVAGSILPLQWTAQHGAGTNDKVATDIVVQVACEDTENLDNSVNWRTTLTDDCGTGETQDRCNPRDGTPVQNSQDNLNGRATNTIPFNVEQQDDYRYGRHETYQYYRDCKRRARNAGLFLADQKLNPRNINHDATFSRQNPNGDNDNNKNGLECPEESEYYPYWHPTPFMDLAVITSDASKCAMIQAESQNVKEKNYCECSDQDCGNGQNPNPGNGRGGLPNNERACLEKGGQWKAIPAFGLPPPDCVVGDFSRDNHLGNVAGEGQAANYNLTIPDWLAGKTSCTLRLRYNMTSTDFDGVAINGDSTMNGDNSPLVDREDENNANGGREAESYMAIKGLGDDEEDYKLGFAVNTDQYARTFQDRTYMFSVKERTTETAGACGGATNEYTQIYNLNVRGKRGNIVQVYPSVEYDFVPNKMTINSHDCMHIQWTGSDYNPNRNPNNGEGGPPDPQNDQAARADRSNIVQMNISGNNYVDFDSSNYQMFDMGVDEWTKLAFLDQPITDTSKCNRIETLIQTENNRQDRERSHKNCMKLSGQASPYFNLGVVKAGKPGDYKYMSTRNNNFSNRGQKGKLTIVQGVEGSDKSSGSGKGKATDVSHGEKCQFVTSEAVCSGSMGDHCKWDGTSCYSRGLSAGSVVGVVIGVLVGVAAATALAVVGYRKLNEGGSGGNASRYTPAAAPPTTTVTIGSGSGSKSGSATAIYEHKAKEAGELEFKKGDTIDVLKKDPSGWWEGRNTRTGAQGVFPANYVKV